jgi:hypothetical protein
MIGWVLVHGVLIARNHLWAAIQTPGVRVKSYDFLAETIHCTDPRRCRSDCKGSKH